MASVHNLFTLDREAQTARIIKAIEEAKVLAFKQPNGEIASGGANIAATDEASSAAIWVRRWRCWRACCLAG